MFTNLRQIFQVSGKKKSADRYAIKGPLFEHETDQSFNGIAHIPLRPTFEETLYNNQDLSSLHTILSIVLHRIRILEGAQVSLVSTCHDAHLTINPAVLALDPGFEALHVRGVEESLLLSLDTTNIQNNVVEDPPSYGYDEHDGDVLWDESVDQGTHHFEIQVDPSIQVEYETSSAIVPSVMSFNDTMDSPVSSSTHDQATFELNSSTPASHTAMTSGLSTALMTGHVASQATNSSVHGLPARTHPARSFPCSQCNVVLGRNYDRKRHIQQRHSQPSAWYPCLFPGCNRTGLRAFPRKDKLSEHRRDVHRLRNVS